MSPLSYTHSPMARRPFNSSDPPAVPEAKYETADDLMVALEIADSERAVQRRVLRTYERAVGIRPEVLGELLGTVGDA